jgi:uncharacterized protein (TIGR03643 family)
MTLLESLLASQTKLAPPDKLRGTGAPTSSSLTEADISRIIEMAWEDRTSFEAIEHQFGLNESAVIRLMRAEMKASSFKMWRKRMSARVTKHEALRPEGVYRHRASHTRQA